MTRLDELAHLAAILLKGHWLPVTELSDKLNVCPRRTQDVVRHLHDSGYTLLSQYRKGRKFLCISREDTNGRLAEILHPKEQKIVQDLMSRSGKRAERVILKLIQAATTKH
ncbi:hypothetical protein J2I47_19230 [Fibrella sp. HMF5335]|uniref:Uncharacterized protein n=1 Tax=Fibrella rubiginis TaxID=2817060 RepID=A0A939K2Y9_9BACT|nr:hypothetical protein [Fibrella rubiginis]MBO0938692.1 hypothetical protein [Fibrella rubiginis]